jgi:K+-sensing histidine kinase KdpD
MPQGVLVGLGALAVVGAGVLSSLLPAADAAARYGVLVLTLLAFAAWAKAWPAALTVALIGFLVFDGFLVNRLGLLSWHGWTDVTRVVAILAAVTFGRLIGDLRGTATVTMKAKPISGRGTRHV